MPKLARHADKSGNTPKATLAPLAGKQATPDVPRLLDELVELWETHRRKSLQVRHQTGRRLNDELGPPTKRQKRNAGVLLSVKERLQISVSELSRMRWFAYRFGSLSDLQPRQVTTWTEVKVLLAQMRSEERRKASRSATRTDASRPYHGYLKTLRRLTARLKQGVHAKDFLAEERQKLQASLVEFAQAAGKHLGIHVSVKKA
jgi:hypothetical protein